MPFEQSRAWSNRRRACIDHVRSVLPKKVSERRICRALGQHRSTQRRRPRGRDDEAQLTEDIVELARCYARACPARVSEDDVLESARQSQGLERIDQIKFAVLEIGGSISIIPKDE